MRGDGYEELAEFHDLFMGGVWDRVGPVLARELGHLGPDDQVADLGAGTGLGSVALVERTTAQVWAVEPSLTMRAVLLHRVAASPEAARRVSVAAGSIPDALDLAPVPVAGVVATHVLGHLDAGQRTALFAWIARVLAPHGVALFTCATRDQAGADTRVEEVGLGCHRYRATHAGAGEEYHATYEVLDVAGRVVRSLAVSGAWSSVTYGDVAAAAERYGMSCRRLPEGLALVTHAARAA